MRFSAYLPLSIQRYPAEPAEPAAPARRWWLGWLQLLGAWLLCMLLCANIALVLAKGLPMDDARPGAGKPRRCVAAEGILKPVAALDERQGERPGQRRDAAPCKDGFLLVTTG
ncbi:hypothetical protein [Variovorax sp. DXTD-1]|uniref:hypothetical protein n=1 Tax=Variovorax sp. DXTD-1 TaxID=2495592 RepID=UPI000F8944A4|nr:hypothetical protein [Variovorax sp. DXTD-1]RST51716.1 hypothetical protein EJI00_09130 [Variovorax sp. DXTD-1]